MLCPTARECELLSEDPTLPCRMPDAECTTHRLTAARLDNEQGLTHRVAEVVMTFTINRDFMVFTLTP